MTNQQALVLAQLRTGQKTTRDLAAALDMTPDQARNCAKRMEDRGWITGMGSGMDRKWSMTGVGNSAWDQEGVQLVGAGAAASTSSNGATAGSQSGGKQQVLDEGSGELRDETDEEQAKREGTGVEPEGSPTRTYIVLEEITLAAHVQQVLGEAVAEALLEPLLDALEGVDPIYVKVATPIARNTEHAHRQTAKDVYKDVEVEEVELVAVAAKNFQPTPVNVNNRQTVSIGKPRSLVAA